MNLQNLRDDLRYTLGNISTTELSNTIADRLLNEAYQRATAIKIRSSGTWKANGNEVTADIESGLQEYTLTTPIPLKNLLRVEINLTGDVNAWYLPEVIDLRQVQYPLNNNNGVQNTENQIRLYDNSIFLMTVPTENVTDGIHIWYSAESADLKERYKSTLQEAAGKYLYVENMPNASGLTVTMSQNTSDALSVTNPSTTSLLIKLANTTASLNTEANIEAAIQALGVSNGFNWADVTCSSTNWTSITGGTITTGTGAAALTGYDTPDLYTENQGYLVNYAAYKYCKSFNMTTRMATFKDDYLRDEENIKVAYTNRLPFERAQITTLQANYK